MRIIIEEHQYEAAKVEDILRGIMDLHNTEGKISVGYVGYFYNPTLKDCVFILPKVLMDPSEQVFGHCIPEEIIHLEQARKEDVLDEKEYDFIYELAVWIYRAIVVYQDTHGENGIVYRQLMQQMAHGRIRKCDTYLDILLALQKFNRENQDFFLFILRNTHSGYNKINWTKTISHSQAFLQNGAPVYLNPVNKKRQINFDEELLIIFFSILKYMNEHWGFPVKINVNFPLITGEKFQSYLNGMGEVRLKQIKYKYFSDKALYLWDLCDAFFVKGKSIRVETDTREYLLAKSFNIVFEAIIDELVGSQDLPTELKEQKDGKRVDHLYQYRTLTNNDSNEPVYYIGDSKYYKRGDQVGTESVYKQFTYARNVIQWNINLFNSDKEADKVEQKKHIKLRDDVTEGYNVIPNFFISAQQKDLKREDTIKLAEEKNSTYFSSTQFANRLYDRDSFLIAHYDVNFLFVIALYGQNNPLAKEQWKEKVRTMFRTEIQQMLRKHYTFYAMTAHADVDPEAYIKQNFQMVLGKVFTPFEDKDYYSLALDKDKKYDEENEELLSMLRQDFEVEECDIGRNPAEVLPKVPRQKPVPVPRKFLTMHWLENYLDANILIGCYKDQTHLEWIQGKNDKETIIYNVRLDKIRDGGVIKSHVMKNKVTFVVLYQFGQEDTCTHVVYRVHHTATMTKERMEKAMYPVHDQMSPKYFCYVMDEEVTLGDLDLANLLSWYRINDKDNFVEGAPLYIKGSELIKYRN